MSRSAPLFLNYYLRQNADENFRLARKLLNDRIDDRGGARVMALIVLTEHAARTGQHEVALEGLDNLYPHLFDDPPHDLDKELRGTYFVGLAMVQSGEWERGSYLRRSFLESAKRYDDAYGVSRRSVVGHLVLGDTDAALDKLAGLAKNKYRRTFDRLYFERSSLYDPIREEPTFIALLDEYRENAAEQRRILQEMNEDTFDRNPSSATPL